MLEYTKLEMTQIIDKIIEGEKLDDFEIRMLKQLKENVGDFGDCVVFENCIDELEEEISDLKYKLEEAEDEIKELKEKIKIITGGYENE